MAKVLFDMANASNLLLLYDRPLERSFVAKGSQKAVFEVPQSYLVSSEANTCFVICTVQESAKFDN